MEKCCMNTFLNLIWAGEQKCDSNYKVGPLLRDRYILHYILDGQGVVDFKGHVYTVSKGQMFLIYQNEVIMYCADKHHPWHYVWVDFSGNAVDELLSHTAFTKENRVTPFLPQEEVVALFGHMHNHFGNPCAETEGAAALLQLFSYLMKKFPAPESNRCIALQAADLLQASARDPNCKIEKIAELLGVSRSQLFRLFKAKFDISPKQYLENIRFSIAEKLLHENYLTISEIAFASGYADPLHFSTEFKKRVGISPKNYATRSSSPS